VSTSSDTWARRIGLAVGLLAALVAVLSWRVAAEGAGMGAEARFVAVPPGELTVRPAGAFIAARGLEPGALRTGRLELRNITGGPLAVRLRGLPSGPVLDRLLRVELAAGGEVVFRGRLGRLRAWTTPFVLDRAQRRDLAARVWLAAGAGGASAGAAVDVTVELRAEPLRG
jgi:hypothetical protein